MRDFSVIEQMWRTQFDELAAGWEDLPPSVRAHPGLKRIRLAALILSDNVGSMATRIATLTEARNRLAAEVQALREDAEAYRQKAETLVLGLFNEFVDVDFSSWPEMQSVQAEYEAKCKSFVSGDAARGKGEA